MGLTRKKGDPTTRGLEICEITPVILGGSPTDPDNKTLLTREQHFEVVRYWNRVLANLQRQGKVDKSP